MEQTLSAPAKLNLCLYLGPQRADGMHELVSVFEPITLADELKVTSAAGDADAVECGAIPGPDLTAAALAALRGRGWEGPPLDVRVEKKIPVAAGLGGGSADAAAILRLAMGDSNGVEPAAEGIGRDAIAEIAAGLGADVPSQLRPQTCLVSGAGEGVEPLAPAAPHWIVLVADPQGLATGDVYAEADRLGLGRDRAELDALGTRLRAAFAGGAADVLSMNELLENDLEPAAVSLRPGIDATLDALRAEGAVHAAVTGSGPTVFGLFAAPGAAHIAAHRLGEGPGDVFLTQPLELAAGAER